MKTVVKVGSGTCKRCHKEVKGQLVEGERMVEGEVVDVVYFEDFCRKSCRDAYRVVILQKMTTLAEEALFGVVYPILGGTHVRVSENGDPLTNEELAQYIDDEVREKYYTYWEENMKASYSKLRGVYDLSDWVGEWKQPPGVNNGEVKEAAICRWCGTEVSSDYGTGDEFPLWERCLCDVWTLLMRLLTQLRQSGDMTEKEINDLVDYYEKELRCDEES